MAKKAVKKSAKATIKKVSVPVLKEDDWATIKAIPGSLVITPIELKAFKKLLNLDLKKILKDLQNKIYKK